MKQKIKYYLLLFFSRPFFFPFILKLQKFVFLAMNRASAATLPLTQTGEIQAFEYVLARLKKNKLVIFDCGAQHGHYSEMVAEVLKKHNIDSYNIYLFEPGIFLRDELSVKFLNDSRFHIIDKAVADVNGEAKLFYPWEGAGTASLSSLNNDQQSITEGNNQKYEIIETIIMDDFCEQLGIHQIDFIKLDIEGYEFKALLGLHKMIKNKRVQFIQFEQGVSSLDSKQLLKDFWDAFHDAYHFYIILHEGLVRIDQYATDYEIFYGATNYMMEFKK